MNAFGHRYPRYGTVGLAILLMMETAIFCSRADALAAFQWWRVTQWATPVCWWSYILVIDAWLYRRNGVSLLVGRSGLFVLQCILSVAFWCLFEAYNRLMPGWQYVNLHPRLPVRFVGYALSFATIMPALFLTCELLQGYQLFSRWRMPVIRWTKPKLMLSLLVGITFCFAPPFFPEQTRGYLWAFVWMGWFFFLEPINYWRGAQSIFRDWEQGSAARTLQLFAAGAICGFLWEFWNMWAHTKWIYVFPLGQDLKLFEMPLLGFFGFLPFALEYFTMFHFLSSFYSRDDKLGL